MGDIPELILTEFINISETNTVYYANNAKNTESLTSIFKNIIQLNYISLNGGIKNTPIKNNKSTITWNSVPNVIQGTFNETITYTITLYPSKTVSTVTNANSFTFTKLKTGNKYNYSVSYIIGPFGETVEGSLNGSTSSSDKNSKLLFKLLHTTLQKFKK